ncbi:MAG: choice-of-anchor L domain-containing protein [Lewinellaceae bacterium]|nr:choice-of-anchor L domain-containing protein [Saprospiraceae bacterium]MCB9330727.1 choice-of-anchor L domain-containing protein [Lewinellaceae bacterium]
MGYPNRYTLCFLLCSCFCVQTGFTQNQIQVALTNQRQRIPIDVNAGLNRIRVCGLQPGTTYAAVAAKTAPDQDIPLQMQLADPALEAAAKQQSRPDRPQHRMFVANEGCIDLLVFVETKNQTSKLPVLLSVGCTDCAEATVFLEKFSRELESLGMANLSVSGGIPANTLIRNTLIGGDCFDVANVSATGPAYSRGTFSNGSASIGIENGIVLCTGSVINLPGPNTSNSTSANGAGFNLNTNPDDPDLATLTDGNQWDLSTIEFDFTPTANAVQFEYVFGSEEYCEFANSTYNDVFGFFISGPGIAGTQNLALLPSTTTPVTINNVNHVNNTAYYVNNTTDVICQTGIPCCTNDCSLDGWTTPLTATLTNLTPCATYHIKLAIADITDGLLFSAVFLKANSFDAGGSISASTVYPNGQPVSIEGCENGVIRFVRSSGDLNTPLTVHYSIGGTATPGDDYAVLPDSVIIPAGDSIFLLPITVFNDLIAEGQEFIVLTLDNACSCQTTALTFTIDDKPPLDIEMADLNICGDTSTVLSPAFSASGVAPLHYLWNTGDTTATLTISTLGTTSYSLTVTDACGETDTASAMVTLEPAPVAVLSGSGSLCAGMPDFVVLSISMSGPGPWTVGLDSNGTAVTRQFSSSPGTISISDPGMYALTSVVTAAGCPGTVSGMVSINEITVDLALTPTDPLCFGAANGSITATPSGGTGPFLFVWNTGADSSTITGLGPGMFTVTATNSEGCSASASTSLGEPPQLTAEIVDSTGINCNNPTGSADLSVGGGTPGFMFNWSNSDTVEDPVFDSGGTYTVTVSDANGCSATATVSIAQDTVAPTAVAALPNPLTCDSLEVTIDAGTSAQGPAFSYSWDGPGIICCANTLAPRVDAPGTYTLTVTNSDNGCTNTVSVLVVEDNAPPLVVISPPQMISCDLPELPLDASGSASGPEYTFSWNTADGHFACCTNTLQPQVDLAGTYALQITNTNTGCSATASVTISGNSTPPEAVIAPAGQIDCGNLTLQLDGSGSTTGSSISYQWTAINGGNILSGQSTPTAVVDQGGDYSLVVLNSENNCMDTATVHVIADLVPPDAMATANGTLTCQSPSINLDGNGSSTGLAITYLWTTQDGNLVSGETGLNPVVNQGGTYTLLVTNTANSCTDTASITVAGNQDQPIANAGPTLQLNCTQAQVQLEGSGSVGPNFTIQWTANPGFILSGDDTFTPTVNAAGTYTLVVTDTANGCSSEDVVNISANFDTPVASIAMPSVINCANPEIELDASNSTQGNGIVFTWNTPNGNIVSGGATPNPTVDAPGQYILVLTNSLSSCVDSAMVTVLHDLSIPTADAGPGDTLRCSTPQINLNGSGSSGPDFFYSWLTADGNIVSGANTLSPEIDAAGTYTLIVTDTTNGCTAESTVTIAADQNVPLAFAGNDAVLDCFNPNIQLNGTGSTAGVGISYQWTANPGNIVSGATSLTPLVDADGFYTLVVTNAANGCTASAEVAVGNNIVYPTAAIAPPTEINCSNSTVQLDAGASSQGITINFSWSSPNGNITGGNGTPFPQVDQPGTYVLVLQNTENGCVDSATVEVFENITPPIAAADSTAVLTCLETQISLNGQGSSSGPNIEYNWTTAGGNIISGQQTLNPVVDQPGGYTLTVFNLENGCTTQAAVQVSSDQQLPAADAGAAQTLTCAVPEVSLNGSNSAQGAPYSYQWTTTDGNILTGANSLNPLVDAAGTYTLLVTNSETGCTAESSVSVGENISVPVATTAPGGTLSCLQSSLVLDGSGSSTGNAFIYLWSSSSGNIVSGQGTLNPTVNAVGVYSLLVTDTLNGCTASADVQITADASLPIANAGPADTLNCLASESTLNGTASSQGGQYSYIWSGPGIVSGDTTLTPVINLPGTYVLLITDTANGCTASSGVTILEDRTVPLVMAGPDDLITCIDTMLALSGNASGNGALLSYSWSSNTGSGILSGATTLTPQVDQPGIYTLTVTNNANGCTATDQVEITQNTVLPVANAGLSGMLTCAIQNIVLNGSGSNGAQVEYLWTTVDGHISAGQGTLNPTVNAPGTYALLATDTVNGCTATATVQVMQNIEAPVAIIESPPTLGCILNQITLNTAGSSTGTQYGYNWSTTDGNILSGAGSPAPTADQPGTYTLILMDTTNSCSDTVSTLVMQDITPPSATAGSTDTLTCVEQALQLNGGGSSTGPSTTYLWSTLDGNITFGANSLFPLVDAPGLYTLQVTNQLNGCTGTSSVQIFQSTNVLFSVIEPPVILTCNVTMLVLNGLGSSSGPGIGYQWNTIGGMIQSGANSLQPTVSAPGSYTLQVTDSLTGCTTTTTTVVQQDTVAPAVDAGIAGTITCTDTLLSLNGTGSGGNLGIGYSWSTTNGSILSGSNTAAPAINSGGIYTLAVYDLFNGCSSTDQVVVPVDTLPPSIAIAAPDSLTCSQRDVLLDATGSAQGPMFSYSWSGPGVVSGDTGLTPVVNLPGIYQISITNSVTGCTASASILVVEDIQPPIAEAGNGFELNCTVEEGLLSATGSSAGPLFSYAWSTTTGNITSGANSAMPSVNAAGSYTLLVTNQQNGCTASDAVVVQENTNYPSGIDISTAPPGCKGNTGTIRIDTVTGGTGPYLYSIDGGKTFLTVQTFEGLSPGLYHLTVQDMNGCEYSDAVNLPPPVIPVVGLGADIALEFGDSVKLTALFNIPPYTIDTIIWSPQAGLTFTGNPAVVYAKPFVTTEYKVFVQNEDGCTAEASIRILVNQPDIWAPNAISPNREDGFNDVFLIFSGKNAVRKINTLQIFDRWGNLVFQNQNFQPNDEKQGWDGIFRGKPMNPAVFVWWAEIELADGQILNLKGDVTIVK